MPNCGVCVKVINAKQMKIVCSDCHGEFHATCLKMSKADVDCITVDGLVWRCSVCAENRRKSMRFESDADEGKLTLQDVMAVVQEIRDSQKAQEMGYNTAHEALNERLEENTTAVRAQTKKLDKYCELIEQLTAENRHLKQKVVVLENRIEEMEQYSRSNAVEIQGISQKPNEDVLSVVKEVGKALDFEISDGMVDACHRLRRTQNGGNPPGIIVKFVRRLDKEQFLNRRRVKRDLSTRHMGRSDDVAVYVNESLSPARRRLLAAARAVQKEKNYKFLWVRNGKIFVRKLENEAVIVITAQEDLSKL